MTKEEKDILPMMGSREMTTEERALYFVKRLLNMQKKALDMQRKFEAEIMKINEEDQK